VRQTGTAREDPGGTEALTLIEQVVRRENLIAAHARVVRNGGAPGVDGMTVDDLMSYGRQHWVRTREQLLSGTTRPSRTRAWAFGRGGARIRRSSVRASTSGGVTGGWWTWTSRNSLTGSITTC
jgi:RNA-directed DNA polymerase